MKHYDVIALGELLIDFACTQTDADGYPVMAAHPGGAPANFLAALTQGLPLETCMARAAAASAISVTRQGAAPSIPRAEEVDAMLRRA